MDAVTSLQGEAFLLPEADLSQRWVALRLQVQAWYLQCSRTSENRSTFRTGNIFCTTSQCILPSEEAIEDDQLLESIIDWYRAHRQKGAIMWYLHPTPPVDLDARFYARGVCPNWEPHWMWLELRDMKQAEARSDRFNIRVKAQNESAIVPDSRDSLVWEVQALRKNEWLGGCVLNVTAGEHGLGGLFDMYVHPQERRQGIGRALTQATCELAMKLGCHHVMVNATDEGESVYRHVGFHSMGMGRTWFLRDSVLALPPPSIGQVRFLEAIGRGDIKTLDAMKEDILPKQLSEETVNGETPLEIAVRCNQPVSGEWLIDRGVMPDIMSLWDLGWRDRIPILLAAHPELVKRKAGRWTATPLHYAIERDDMDMVKLLLSIPNDLESKDGVFQSTPLEWAKRFQRTEIIALLESVRETNT